MPNIFFKKSRTEYPIALNGVKLGMCGMIRVNAANSRYDKRPLLVIRRCFCFGKSKPSTSNYRSVNINRYFKTLVVCLAAQNTRKIWRIEYLLCGRYSISERNIVWRFVSIVFFEAFAFAQKTFSVLPLPNV
jgi:hypothetical protein